MRGCDGGRVFSGGLRGAGRVPEGFGDDREVLGGSGTVGGAPGGLRGGWEGLLGDTPPGESTTMGKGLRDVSSS